MRHPLLALGLVSSLAISSCSSDKGLVIYNTAPTASIIQPEDGHVFEGETPAFVGFVSDDDPVEDLLTQWSSSIDGILIDEDPPDASGGVELVTNQLSEGEHIMTLRVFDADGGQDESYITVTIKTAPQPPAINIDHPARNEQGLEDQPFIFMATVSDGQDNPEDLAVEVSAQPGGFVCDMDIDGDGNATCAAILGIGPYLLTFTATDTDGNDAKAQANYEVVDRDNYDADGDGVSPNGGDCNDSNDTIYPGAPELCDTLDNDCSDLTGIDVGSECWDNDGDGFCVAPPCMNASESLSDCDDTLASVNPNATEPADINDVNGRDDDCDGDVDENTIVWDDDGDGYCEAPPCNNTNRNKADCDDANSDINPGMDEICSDGIDNDCDGQLNQPDAVGCTTFWYDNDGDTFGVSGLTLCYCDEGLAHYTGLNANDCDDNSDKVWPGQPAWFSAAANGSFDYDCDGAETKRYLGTGSGCQTSTISCDVPTPGWVGSVPSCGQNGDYLSGCSEDWASFLLTCLPCTFPCLSTGSAGCANCIITNCPNGMSCDLDPTSISTQECH